MRQTKVSGDFDPVSFLAMFTSPLATFEALRERPRWLYPVLLSAIVSVAANLYVVQNIGLDRLIEAASQSKAVIDPQSAVQNVMAHQGRILCFQAASVFINIFVVALVTAKVFWLILTLMGHDLPLKRILAVVAHANMIPIIARGGLTAVTAAVISDVRTLDLRNPLATNIAFFLHPESAAGFRILTSLDAITFWNIGLLIVGLTRMCPKLPARTASLTVILPWIVYVCTTLLVSG